MKFTQAEIEHILCSPDALQLAADYNDAQCAKGGAMGFDCSGNLARYEELINEYEHLNASGDWNEDGIEGVEVTP